MPVKYGHPSDYVPISCEFHDRLEDLATLRKLTNICYANEGQVQQREAVIKDVFAREGAEYLSLSSGQLVRLDRLVEVDGISFSSLSAHCGLK